VAKAALLRGHAREQVLDAALALFAAHGVNGTSLQMIADRLGVTKASVYYHFQSKDDIVLAVIAPVFDDVLRVVRIAEALSTPDARREVALSGLVELSVRHRRLTAVFYGDPAVECLIKSRQELEASIESLRNLLVGPEADTTRRVAVSLLTAGIAGAATDPELRDVADTDLHRALLISCQQLLRAATAS
jgi:AcrR family transcriptional regulator